VELRKKHAGKTIRLFFEDEASFGRISEPKYCWCRRGVRPSVPCQRVREYRTMYGAVEPATGEFFYVIEEKEKPPKSKRGRPKKGEHAQSAKPKPKQKGKKSREMNAFMQKLATAYPNDQIVLVMDNAWWHKSQYTKVPEGVTLAFIPPSTPEMNPIEQIWREIRTRGFGNRYFRSITEVEKQLRETIDALPPATIRSITQRDWIVNAAIPKGK